MLFRQKGGAPKIRTQLESTKALFERSQRALIMGDAELGITAAESAPVVAQLNKVQEIWGGLDKAVDSILKSDDLNTPKAKKALEQLVANNVTLLKEANIAVGLIEDSDPRRHLGTIMKASIGGTIFLFGLMFFLAGSAVISPISHVAEGLGTTSGSCRMNAQKVSAAAKSVSSAATEQAASLEQTAASLEEMSSITSSNAENASKANEIARKAREASQDGRASMEHLITAMSEITASSAEMAKIVKNIEGIAFQTNLLALNAAVEAARAGEHGKGFAVVAEEVRNLAQRAAEAARNTGSLIDETGERVENGMRLSERVGSSLNDITSSSHQVADLIAEIATAGAEISQGIDQINRAVTEMDRVTQANAGGAEESASVANELEIESEKITSLTNDLCTILGTSLSTGDRFDVRSSRSHRRDSGSSSGRNNSVDRAPTLLSRPMKSEAHSMTEDPFPMESGFDEF